jgi:hypothetical protein
MTEPKTQVIFDASTGIETVLELTKEELDEIKDASDLAESIEQAKIASRTSALAKLAALGLTEEEIAAL